MSTDKRFEWLDVLMENGEIARCEVPQEHYDTVMEDLDNCIKRGDRWPCAMYDGQSCNYMGIDITTLNTKKIVGIL